SRRRGANPAGFDVNDLLRAAPDFLPVVRDVDDRNAVPGDERIEVGQDLLPARHLERPERVVEPQPPRRRQHSPARADTPPARPPPRATRAARRAAAAAAPTTAPGRARHGALRPPRVAPDAARAAVPVPADPPPPAANGARPAAARTTARTRGSAVRSGAETTVRPGTRTRRAAGAPASTGLAPYPPASRRRSSPWRGRVETRRQ